MKEQYETPELTKLGTVTELTKGGGGQQTDQTGSATIIEQPK